MRNWLRGAVRASALACALRAAVLASAVLGAAPASAQSVERYDFEVSWSVFPDLVLARGTLALEEDSLRYRMAMEARARVPFPAVEWDGFFATEGRLEGDGRAPEVFERLSRSPIRVERAQVLWGEDGAPPQTRVEVSPPRPRAAPVDPATVGPDTVDPLTFVAMIYDRVIETNGDSCDVEAATWDGVRLANLQATTGDKLRAARVDCLIGYLSIDGLSDTAEFNEREEDTRRIVRFEKRLGRWRPVWVRIEGEFAGFESTFITNFTPTE